jgi:multidrug efflux pump subunit AcrB
VAVMFGLMGATVLTLVVVPVVFTLVDQLQAVVLRKLQRKH